MIHPFLRVVATQPHLLVDHAEAYAGLVGEELGKTAAAFKHRAMLMGAAAFFAVVAVIFGGVALMLYAVSPPSQLQMPWLLVATPVVPAVVALICALAGRRKEGDAFAQLKQQIARDLAMVRDVSAA